MTAVYAWVKNLIVCLCLLELFCHLVRSADYRRYIRFFGGLIVLALMLQPLKDFFPAGASFESALQRAFARQEACELQEAQEALAGLKNRRIFQAYQQELHNQIEDLVKANGCTGSSVRITLCEEGENPLEIAGVDIVLMPQNSNLNVFEEDESGRAFLETASAKIRSEIAAVYGVDSQKISVTLKE